MNPDPHSTALRLILREKIEGLDTPERGWLAEHLENCASCASTANSTDGALRKLRSCAVAVPPTLASRTQMRVRLRARGRSRSWTVWTACAVSWAAGIASAPSIWRLFHWLGQSAGLPDPVWKAGVVLWWAIPAVIAAGALLLRKDTFDESGL